MRRDATGERRTGRGREISAERHIAGHQPSRSFGIGRAGSAEAQSATRHIPVHVVSVSDYKQEALELGAVGYALKPAKREELIEALKRLEAKFSQNCGACWWSRTTRASARAFASCSPTTTCRSPAWRAPAKRCWSSRPTTFDCMVVDFNLPDFSGYDLLEKMARQEDGAFPPVIVYTGPRIDARRGAAAAALLEIHHHQGRAFAGAAAGRGHAVSAPGRVPVAA